MVKAFRKALIVKIITSIALVFISLIASFGINTNLSQDLEVLAIASLSKRAPRIAELSADSMHHVEYRYEVGNEGLLAETSKNLELNLSKQSGNSSFDLNVYRNQIDDFIHCKP